MSQVFQKLYDFTMRIFLVEFSLTFSGICIYFMVTMGLE